MTSTTQQLPPNLEKIIKKFQRITEEKRRYEYLLWFAKRMPPFPDEAKIPAYRVPGCVSQVYVTATLQDGCIVYQADADAQIPKGLVGLLIEGLNGMPPEEVVQLSPDFIQLTGLNVSLTPSRSNGFYNIFKTMQQRAIALTDSL
ncbi:MAG: SufE family protein [Oscillatoria sp. SIO1A7]|nr:SufE family protein [Oscillatoria sp. SIO1A7]